jgi:hypothetical protein
MRIGLEEAPERAIGGQVYEMDYRDSTVRLVESLSVVAGWRKLFHQ